MGQGLKNCALVGFWGLREEIVDRQLMFVVDDDRRWPDPCRGREVGLGVFSDVGCFHILHRDLPFARGPGFMPRQAGPHVGHSVPERIGEALVVEGGPDQGRERLFEIGCAFQRVV